MLKNRSLLNNILIGVLIALGLLMLASWRLSGPPPTEISVSGVINAIQAGQVQKIAIEPERAVITLREGGVKSVRLSSKDDVLGKYLVEYTASHPDARLEVVYVPDNATGPLIFSILLSLLPVLLIGGFFFYMMRQSQGGQSQMMSFTQNKAKIMVEKPDTTFEDVAGVEEAKNELKEIVEFLKAPERFTALGAHVPKGALLIGAPGTGKTLLARAVAGEAGVSFMHMSGSEFVEMFVGVGSSRVRSLFSQAKRFAPTIIFIDEIDAIGRQRGSGLGGSHDEREQTLNQILVEMDGFDANVHIVVLAATNRPDVLDPALLRPGRFDRQVVLDKPDIKGRTAILKVHTKTKPLGEGVNLEKIAKVTPGFSGAELANVANEGAILAARRGGKFITQNDLQMALEKVAMGPERKSRILSEKEKAIVAWHEAGHALCFKFFEHTNPVHKISIVSRGMAMGVTWSLPTEDRYFKTRQEFENDIAAALGGWVAEQMFLNGDVTTGASNDIEKATEMARHMVTKYGMSTRLGPRQYGNQEEATFLGRQLGDQRAYSEDVAKVIDEEVSSIVENARVKTQALLEAKRDVLERVVAALLVREVLEAEEFEAIVEGMSLESLDTLGKVPPVIEPKPDSVTKPGQVTPDKGWA